MERRSHRPERARNRNRLRAVILDAYGTLFHYEPGKLLDVFRTVVERYRLPVEPETLLERWRVHESTFRATRITRGSDGRWWAPPPDKFISYQTAWADGFRQANAELGITGGPDVEAVAILLDDLRRRDMYRDVPPALEALRARVPLALVSNADRAFLFDTLAHNGVSFDTVVLSEDERVYKPHPHIFESALQQLGIDDPTHALYVGDSPTEDVTGAAGVGIPTVWINRTGVDWPLSDEERPTHEVKDLLGLVDVVSSRARVSF